MSDLDLSRNRSFADVLSTFRVWFRHFPVFFTLALLPVTPSVVVVDGLWSVASTIPALPASFRRGWRL